MGLLFGLWLAGGCGDGDPLLDAGRDSGDGGEDDAGRADAGDAGFDAGVDAGDAGADADVGADAGLDAGLDATAEAGPCTSFDPAMRVGEVSSSLLDEISGLAASRDHPGVLFVHNDDEAMPRFFAIAENGRLLGDYRMPGATFRDTEDIALGPGPGGPSLYLGDIGDNAARTGVGATRTSIVVFRIPEPEADPDQAFVTVTVDSWDELRFVYPDRPHDAEALLADPWSGDLYLVSKETDGLSTVFRAPAPHTPGLTVTLTAAGMVAFDTPAAPGHPQCTGGDVSPSGTSILIRTYSSVLLFPRLDPDLGVAFDSPAVVLPHAMEPQGEAVGFAADGLGYFTISEGVSPPIWFFAAAADCR